MPFFKPQEETLTRRELEELQRRKLTEAWKLILSSNRFYQERLAGIAFHPLTDPLALLPVTSRADVEQDQARHPPCGTNLTFERSAFTRRHQTSGTTGQIIRWPDTPDSWEWFKRCWCIVFGTAGVSSEDRIAFPFSFGPFIGFWGAFEAAASFGCLVLPAGGMTTSARVRYILDNEVTVVCCTPTYALRMADVASRENVNLTASPVRMLIVAGEPGGNVPDTRARIEQSWGARVIDHAGMTEIGAWGFECLEAPGGMHVIESEFIAEVLDPNSESPVPHGAVGELVLTNLGRWGSPLIRYRTGDLLRLTQDRCACGRWFARAEGGILGRKDDMLLIRGNNVFPAAIEGLVQSFVEVTEFRCRVETLGSMAELRVDIEPKPGVDGRKLASRIEKEFQDRFHFRPTIALVDVGSLPRFEMKAKRFMRTDPRNP